jgi:hypothetical protein
MPPLGDASALARGVDGVTDGDADDAVSGVVARSADEDMPPRE